MTTTSPYGPDPYRRGSALSGSFLPLALITIGVVFLLSNLVPDRGRGGLVVLGLGAAFIVGRVTTGRYGYAVPGGILLAIGTFISLQDTFGQRGIGSGGIFFMLLGLGFAVVYAVGLRPAAVWPLVPAFVLMGLGLVLLGASLLAPLASLSWIVSYWPVALVLIGAWLLFRDSLPPSMRRPVATLGGLALLGYGVLAAAATVAAGGALERSGIAPAFGSSPFADTLVLEQPIAPGQTLTLTNTSGATTIHGGTGSTVHVVATRHFNVGGQGPEVQLTPSADGVTLSAATSRGRFPFASDSSSVEYAIEVPAAVNVNAQSSSGALEIDGVSGQIHATTSSGAIRATQVQHLVQASSSSGAISLDGTFTDAAQISSSSGAVNLRLEPGTAEQLDVHTQSGRVEPQGLTNLSGGVTRRDTLTGAIGTPAPGATLSVNTSSGRVAISE